MVFERRRYLRVRETPTPVCLTVNSVIVLYLQLSFYRTLGDFGTVGCSTSSLSLFFALIVLQGNRLLSTYGRIYLKNALAGFYHPSLCFFIRQKTPYLQTPFPDSASVDTVLGFRVAGLRV